jgi:FMN-dependent NADH-azoreductase
MSQVPASKRLFIYTSRRSTSVSSALLDRLADRADDTKFRVWDWDLFSQLESVIDMKYGLIGGKLNETQQPYFEKISAHKQWLDSFDEVYFGAAMHNFGINVNAKTYFDVFVQPGTAYVSHITELIWLSGIAFTYVDGKPKGLMKSNRWNFVIAGGGNALATPELDFVIPWIKQAFAFIGIANIAIYAAKGTLYPGFDVSKQDIKFDWVVFTMFLEPA